MQLLKKLNYKFFIIILFFLLGTDVFSYWECEWDEKKEDIYSSEKLDAILMEETSIVRINFLLLIRFYQRGLSEKNPSECNFYPSCSRYGFYAIKKYGGIKGSLMALDRIIRCNPWAYTANYPVDYEHQKLFDPVEKNDTFNFIFDFLNF